MDVTGGRCHVSVEKKTKGSSEGEKHYKDGVSNEVATECIL